MKKAKVKGGSMAISRTVIISCAGMGNRLGLGSTKALVEIDGKPLVIRHLEMLDEEEDIRVVVGYQAAQVIEVVKKYRQDVTFVFNHHYRETGTGASVALASRYANEYILSLDGDLVIHPQDMKKILACDHEFVSGGIPCTDDPWMLQTYQEDGKEYVKKKLDRDYSKLSDRTRIELEDRYKKIMEVLFI